MDRLGTRVLVAASAIVLAGGLAANAAVSSLWQVVGRLRILDAAPAAAIAFRSLGRGVVFGLGGLAAALGHVRQLARSLRYNKA